MYLIRWVDLGLLEKLSELTAQRVDVTERGPASRLSKKSVGKRSNGEGPQEKVYGRMSEREGSTKKVCRRRFAGEGPLEKSIEEGSSKKVH